VNGGVDQRQARWYERPPLAADVVAF